MKKHTHDFNGLFKIRSLILIIFSATISLASNAACTDDSQVFVKKVCDGSEPGFCTTDIKLLDDWLWNMNSPTDYRCNAPSETDPVLVEIGPGHFTGSVIPGKGLFYCPFFDPNLPGSGQDPNGPRNGYVRLRGAGPELTILEAQGFLSGAFVAGYCTDIVVEDISLINNSINSYGIYWYGGGVSRWTNVKAVGYLAGWYDGTPSPCADEKGVHYWFDSIIESPKLVYKSECDENWIYASDLVLKPTDSTATGGIGISTFKEGDVRIFGSSVRLDTSLLDPATEVNIHGVRAGWDSFNTRLDGSGVFHMHGGIISLNAKQSDKSTITGVEVNRTTGGTALAHIVDTAFAINIKPPNTGGIITRVRATPSSAIPSALRSPFQWPAGTTPPLDDELVSLSGYDQYVEIDCETSGLCDQPSPSKPHPHLMIYDDSCTPSPWFNTVTNRCRNDDGT